MTNKKIIEELIEELGESLRTVDVPYSNIGGFGHKAQVQHDKKDLLKEVEGTIQQALSAQKQEIKEMIEESLWQCPMHKELQTDGSCKECNQGLEHNIALYALLKSIKKL